MTTGDADASRPAVRAGRGGAWLGAIFAAVGAYVLVGALTGPASSSYARIGPGFFPAIVGGATIVAGLCLVFQAVKGGWRIVLVDDAAAPGAEIRRDLPAVGRILLVVAALVADVVLLRPFGFVVASAAMYILATRAFGSRALVRDVLVALVFAGAIHLVFLYGLGLRLPAGTVWSWAWSL